MENIQDRISKLSAEKQAVLRQMLLKKTSGRLIPKRSEQGDAPLSFSQMRLWFLDQLEPDNSFYNLSLMLHFKGTLDIAALEKSFNEIIRRHEILRTVFIKKNGVPVQVILPFSYRMLPVTDIPEQLPELREAEVRRLAAREHHRPFDLAAGPLLRLTLLRLNSEEHFLLIAMHHIITDGWSMGIFTQELSAFYKAFLSSDKGDIFPELPIQYADFASWQREWLNDQELERQLDFWKKQLEDAPPVSEIPADRPRPTEQCFRGHLVHFDIDSELSRKLNHLSRQSDASLFMTLLSAFALLLFRYSAQEDILIGTPVANRNHKEIEPLIGFFINTLVLRMNLSDDPGFSELLKSVRQTALDAYNHQDMPFEHLVEALQPERNLSHTPLFQIMFVLQNAPLGKMELPGLSVRTIETETVSSLFDLSLSLTETESGIRGSLHYKTDLFDEIRMIRMGGHFQNLLEQIVLFPDRRISEFSFLSESEQHQLLIEFNDTAAGFPEDKTIAGLFEEQAEKTPDNTAVIFEDIRLSYRQLNEQANRIAHFLKDEFAIQPDDRIGVVLDRSEWITIAILGIMKAGGAYVPVDPSYPRDRIAYMLEDSECRLILTEEKYSDMLASLNIRSRSVNIRNIRHSEKSNPASGITSRHLAYIIYTSGSTGKPKGVMLEHRGFVNMALSQIAQFGMKETDRFLLFASCSFDASMYETFIPLLSGAGVVCIGRNDIDDPEQFFRILEKNSVTLAVLPPAYLRVIGFERLHGLRNLITAGESAVSDEGKFRGKNRRYWNGYGPTEFSVCASCYPISETETFSQSSIPIGKPISNAQMLILDKSGKHLMPIGVPGEICLAGAGLARGYLNRPELTAEKFVPHPFKPGERMYRTGDLGRWLLDGNIEFLGRNDDQVKVRGYRIETGEIRNCLLSHESVKEALVIAKQFRKNIRELAAYVIGADDFKDNMNVNALREHLKKTLPDYMVPSYFILLDKFPLTPNGKTDQKSLPEPSVSMMDSGVKYAAARNEQESVIIGVWASLLRIDKISIYDNYFSIGGDSIKAIQMVSRLAQAGWKMKIRDLFKYPTPAELAQHISPIRNFTPDDFVQKKGTVLLTAVQRWFFQNISIERHYFNQAVLLRGKPRFSENEVKAALEAILNHHDTLRLQYRTEGKTVIQQYPDVPAPLHFEISEFSGSDALLKMEASINTLHAGMNLERGELMKTALYRLGDADRLFITIHHLATDAVSTRILLNDFDIAYTQAIHRQPIRLPDKTCSFGDWAEKVYEYSRSEALAQEKEYWHRVSAYSSLFSDEGREECLNQSGTGSLSIAFSEEETALLFRNIGQTNDIRDILFAALCQALSAWTGKKQISLVSVGHGRESVVDDADLSHTVGWFSSMYPLCFTMPDDPGQIIAVIRETLGKMPNRGIGYSILRYIAEDEILSQRPLPETVFNYIGRIDEEIETESFSMAAEPPGQIFSPAQKRAHPLELTGVIVKGCFMLFAFYDKSRFSLSAIQRFLENYRRMLRNQ